MMEQWVNNTIQIFKSGCDRKEKLDFRGKKGAHYLRKNSQKTEKYHENLDRSTVERD